MSPGSSSWAEYFPFEKGAEFEVEGPFSYAGTGRVLRRTDDVLSFELHMPAKRILVKKIPELRVTFSLTASKEGRGNRAEGTFVRSGEPPEVFKDADIKLETDDAKHSREFKSSIKVGGQPLEISIASEDEDRVKLRINGHKFTLRRTRKP